MSILSPDCRDQLELGGAESLSPLNRQEIVGQIGQGGGLTPEDGPVKPLSSPFEENAVKAVCTKGMLGLRPSWRRPWSAGAKIGNTSQRLETLDLGGPQQNWRNGQAEPSIPQHPGQVGLRAGPMCIRPLRQFAPFRLPK